MKPHLSRVCFAGFVSTTLIALMVFFVSPYLTGGPYDLAAWVSDQIDLSWIGGAAAHLIAGVLLLPAVYVLCFNGWLPGGVAVRGTAFGVVLWTLSQLVLLPQSSGGLLGSRPDGPRVVIESLVGHLVYGIVLGILVGGRSKADDRMEDHHHSRPPVPRAA